MSQEKVENAAERKISSVANDEATIKELTSLVRGAWNFVPNKHWRELAEKYMIFEGEM